MVYEDTKKKIHDIVAKYLPVCEIDGEIPLTGRPYGLDARSLAAIFLDIADSFDVDLNGIFTKDMNYSLNAISRKVSSLI